MSAAAVTAGVLVIWLWLAPLELSPRFLIWLAPPAALAVAVAVRRFPLALPLVAAAAFSHGSPRRGALEPGSAAGPPGRRSRPRDSEPRRQSVRLPADPWIAARICPRAERGDETNATTKLRARAHPGS